MRRKWDDEVGEVAAGGWDGTGRKLWIKMRVAGFVGVGTGGLGVGRVGLRHCKCSLESAGEEVASSSSIRRRRKRRESNDGWATEAAVLKEAAVEHRFFPYLNVEDDVQDASSAGLEMPERRLFLASGAGSSVIARVQSGQLLDKDGKQLMDADAIWTTEQGVGLGALRTTYFSEDPARIFVPVLIATRNDIAIAACTVSLLNLADRMVDDLVQVMLKDSDAHKVDLVAAVGSDQRFSRPVAVGSGLINHLFLSWEDELPRGAKRRLFFKHENAHGLVKTSIIAKSRKGAKGPVVKLAVRTQLRGGEVWLLNVPQTAAERLRQRGIDEVEVLSSANIFEPGADSGDPLQLPSAEDDQAQFNGNGERDSSEQQLAALIAM